jgi:hypothetical protein
MTKPNNGGPAFPTDLETKPTLRGMTLRDYFAGQVIASVKGWHPGDKRGKSSATIAYEIADAMLRAREE